VHQSLDTNSGNADGNMCVALSLPAHFRGDVPVAITMDSAEMQMLAALATHNLPNDQPHFLPVHAEECSKKTQGDDFDNLNFAGRKVFFVFSNIGMDRTSTQAHRDVERELQRRGAEIIDLGVLALDGFATIGDCWEVDGPDAALALFDHAERYLARNVPEGFRLSTSGVYRKAPSQDGECYGDDVWICSSLLVKADTRNHLNEDWGKLLVFLDKDGNQHRCSLPMAALIGNPSDCCAQLLSQGLQIAQGRKAREMVISYILAADPEERVRSTTAVGWHGDTYVLPDQSIQAEHSEAVLHKTSTMTNPSPAVSGSLEEWKDAIGRFCSGNSRLIFAVSCALAAPLLRLVEEAGGGFNFRGASSTGKTTALQVAASVWGGDGTVQTWRMTANALDAVAQNQNDGLLCLDELGQANGKEVGEIVYSLANGSPKQRKTRSVSRGWTLLLLSSGETNLADHMLAAGKSVRSGQEMRLCDIEADAGAGLGMFQDLHGFPNPSAFARHLAEFSRRVYGTPIRAFLKTLVEDKEKARPKVLALRDQFLGHHVPPGATGELRRAAFRFALVGAGGELATAAGLTGWREGESQAAAGVCFTSWLSTRRAPAMVSAQSVIDRVRQFLLAQVAPGIRSGTHASGRGNAMIGPSIIEVRSDSKGAHLAYLVLPDVFRRDICAGLDPKMVMRILKTHGCLEHDRGRYDKSVRLPTGKRRVYSILAGILASPVAAAVGEEGVCVDLGGSGDTGDNSPQRDEAKGVGVCATQSGDSSVLPFTKCANDNSAVHLRVAAATEEGLSTSTGVMPCGESDGDQQRK
jgi:uncharacterized protein (DUF927 family)